MRVIWICVGKRVDNTEMVSFLLSRTYSVSRQHNPPGRKLGVHKKLGGLLTLTDPRDDPGHRTSCSAYKSRGRKRKRETLTMVAFVFPSHSYM